MLGGEPRARSYRDLTCCLKEGGDKKVSKNDGSWPPPSEPDDAAFERVTEGLETILGTGATQAPNEPQRPPKD